MKLKEVHTFLDNLWHNSPDENSVFKPAVLSLNGIETPLVHMNVDVGMFYPISGFDVKRSIEKYVSKRKEIPGDALDFPCVYVKEDSFSTIIKIEEQEHKIVFYMTSGVIK